jgi:hypothetical protein
MRRQTRRDAACRRGVLIKARSVASVRWILQNGLDRDFLDDDERPCAAAATTTEPPNARPSHA